MLLGENSTSSEFFDAGLRMRSFSSDDRMLPISAALLRSGGPWDRQYQCAGIGPPARLPHLRNHGGTRGVRLDGLQTASYGGDLEVRVHEASGEVRSFIVPFATTVQLLRPGTTRYSLTAGRPNDPSLASAEHAGGVYQRPGQRRHRIRGGNFTGSYGVRAMGAALNTPAGGFSGDVTLARTEVPGDDRLSGSSYRLAYSKNLLNTGTNFSLLAYRYSTGGYLGLARRGLHDRVERGEPLESFSQAGGNRLDANISQQLGNGGNLYLNGLQGATGAAAVNFSVGYSNQWRDVSYSISAQRLRSHYEGFSSGDKRGDPARCSA